MRMDVKQPQIVNITRESLLDDGVRVRLEQQYKSLPFLTAEQQQESLAQCLSQWCGEQAVYVFAYGSLIWNPAIHCEAVGTGRLFGRHRRMAIRSMFGCGTPERPGLMLTLLPGGCCDGVVLKIESSRAVEELSLLWRREMISGSYRPRWLPVRSKQGVLSCLVFDHNPNHPSFIGPMTFEKEVEILSQASGPLGPNKDYIYQTVQALNHWQLRDARMSRLEKALRACEI